MPAALRLGYATAGTDTGHSAADGPDGMFALGHPEKIVDFAHRAIHGMTVKSKQLIDVFYEQDLRFSYFKGCSTGGREALMEAQQYPADYDAIIAGSLANRYYYESVLAKMGKGQDDWMRLFMARDGALRRRAGGEHVRLHRDARAMA